LSRSYVLLSVIEAKVLAFHTIKAFYVEDEDFKKVIEDHLFMSLSPYKSFLFRKNKLCIPKSLLRDLIIKEAHGGALAGHFNINKTLEILKEHFYWSKMSGISTM